MHCKPSENLASERGCVIANPCVRKRLRVRSSGCHQSRIRSKERSFICEALLAPRPRNSRFIPPFKNALFIITHLAAVCTSSRGRTKRLAAELAAIKRSMRPSSRITPKHKLNVFNSSGSYRACSGSRDVN